MLAISTTKGLLIKQMDMKGAYLNGDSPMVLKMALADHLIKTLY